MSKREKQIRQELAILKIELNSNYGFVIDIEAERYQKLYAKIVELKEELKSLNQNKDEKI